MNNTLLRAALAALFAASALTACDRQQVDSAVSRTQAELAKAGHEAKQELSQAGEKIKPALQDAGEKTRTALNDVGNKIETKTAEAKSGASPGEASRGLSDAAAAELDTRLVLILANHIGDLDVLNDAIALAKSA